MPPAKSAQEIASKALDKTGAFFAGANQKYQISQKTSVAAEATKAKMSDAAAATKAGASAAAASTKAGFMSLWGRAKTLVAKNGSAASASTEEEQKEESQDNTAVDDSAKAPLTDQSIQEEEPKKDP